MANSYNTSDILRKVLQKCGERTDSNSVYRALALSLLNDAYLAILAGSNEFLVDLGEPWAWAKSPTPKIITLVAPYTSGTISLTNGSTSATLSGAPSVALGSFAGRFLKVDNRPEYFKVASHTAGATALVLDGNYTGDTGSGLTYQLYKLTYSLGQDVLRLVAPMRVYKNQVWQDQQDQIFGLSEERFNLDFPMSSIMSAIPNRYYESYDSSDVTARNLQVTFNGYVDSDCRVEVPYIPFPTELSEDPSSVPVIPREFIPALTHAATYLLMLEKSDSRADTYLGLTQAKLKAMVAANNKKMSSVGQSYGVIQPRQEQVQRNLLRRFWW